MHTKYKWVLALLVVATAVSVIAFSRRTKDNNSFVISGRRQTAPAKQEVKIANPQTAAQLVERASAPATAVDISADEILNAYSGEQTVARQGDGDAAYVQEDTQIINSLGGSYDANQF